MDPQFLFESLTSYGLPGAIAGGLLYYVPKIGTWLTTEILHRLDAHGIAQSAERNKFIQTLENINTQSMKIASDNQISLLQIANTLESHTHTLEKLTEYVNRCPERLQK